MKYIKIVILIGSAAILAKNNVKKEKVQTQEQVSKELIEIEPVKKTTQDTSEKKQPKSIHDEAPYKKIEIYSPESSHNQIEETNIPFSASFTPLDKIVIVIYTDTNTIVITQHILNAKTLDGKTRTQEEVIVDNLLFDKAVNVYHMTPARREAENHIEGLKNQYGLTHKDIEELFNKEGMTYEEGLEQLMIFYTIRGFIYHIITSKVLITQEEIQKYYKEHPEYIPASVKIEKIFVDKEKVTQEMIDDLKKYKIGEDSIVWSTSYWIAIDELIDSKKCLGDLKPGDIEVFDAGNSYEIVRIVKKQERRLKSLEEASKGIMEKLQYQKYELQLKEYKENLLKEYDIVYMK